MKSPSNNSEETNRASIPTPTELDSGDGRYGKISKTIAVETEAEAVILCVVNGCFGHGMAVTVHPDSKVLPMLPALLRRVADTLEQQRVMHGN